jgi:hypothetical protein
MRLPSSPSLLDQERRSTELLQAGANCLRGPGCSRQRALTGRFAGTIVPAISIEAEPKIQSTFDWYKVYPEFEVQNFN